MLEIMTMAAKQHDGKYGDGAAYACGYEPNELEEKGMENCEICYGNTGFCPDCSSDALLLEFGESIEEGKIEILKQLLAKANGGFSLTEAENVELHEQIVELMRKNQNLKDNFGSKCSEVSALESDKRELIEQNEQLKARLIARDEV